MCVRLMLHRNFWPFWPRNAWREVVPSNDNVPAPGRMPNKATYASFP